MINEADTARKDPGPVVVIGAGLAAVSVCEALRRASYGGEIVVVGDEPDPPYDRPPLSKQVLAGTWEPQRASLLTEERWDAVAADWRLGRRATALAPESRTVQLDNGTSLTYGEAVIATGVAPRRLPTGGHQDAHVLRTLDDMRELRSALTAGRRLVVIGAGFLGLEVASTARGLGLQVTVVEPLPTPLESRLSPTVARRLLALHEQHGVDVRTGIGVTAIVEGAVELTDDTTLDADVVLVAIGCLPDLAWLESSGLNLADGVVCDDHCRAAAHIWAAGDIARWRHGRLNREMRLEHRANAAEQGRIVAANIMGADQSFSPIPSFWTDHFDVKVQLMGVIPDGATGTVVEGEADGDSFVIAFDDPASGTRVGVVGWNAMRQLMRYRKQIAEHW